MCIKACRRDSSWIASVLFSRTFSRIIRGCILSKFCCVWKPAFSTSIITVHIGKATGLHRHPHARSGWKECCRCIGTCQGIYWVSLRLFWSHHHCMQQHGSWKSWQFLSSGGVGFCLHFMVVVQGRDDLFCGTQSAQEIRSTNGLPNSIIGPCYAIFRFC